MTSSDLLVLAGRVLIAGFEGATAPKQLIARCAQGALAGVILFRRNLGTMHEVRALTGSLQAACAGAPPLLVGVDQEGGRVARLGRPVLELPAMARLGEIDDPELTERAATLLAQQLHSLGFNLDFAPVLDVATNPANPVIGDRSFGREPERVIRHGRAFARGLEQGGVLSCGKHFPGHGDTELDSHLALPTLRHTRARLDAIELAPFRAVGPELDAIMTAHVMFAAIDAARPATLSQPVLTGILRRELGFKGAIFSDDLEMKAVAERAPIEELATSAIEAGVDLLLVCSKLDWLERAAAALATRAAEDRSFEERLEEAAARADALRAKVSLPADGPLDLSESEALALAAEIRARLVRPAT